MKIFNLPDLGEGLAEAEIREWFVKEGDEVKVDQPLVSMETAKAVVEVPSPYQGKISQLHGKPNDIIKTGSPLISFSGDASQTAATGTKDKGSVVGALEESSHAWQENVIIGRSKMSEKGIKAMPAARVLANEMQIDLSQIKGSGPGGLITPKDVKGAISNNAPMGGTQIDGEALHGVRRIMANVMTESHHTIAPATIIEDVDISHLPQGSDLTVLLLQAIVKAAEFEPSINAWFDGKALQRRLFKEVNIGLAVDSAEGLFVPVIKNAEKKTAKELRDMVSQYKDQIKTRSVLGSDLQGATISLSNFGTITGKYATPVVVPPMVAILGCGRARQAAVVRDQSIQVGKILPLSLTFDHRAATGGEATRFLSAVIDYLQESA